mmetsp:Transcript_63875/g.169711  ORF Transcript_63875/g.169711 Transcript_63875/m.169711 type:complete len:243 (+) Transcript_63875:819-1547(+)
MPVFPARPVRPMRCTYASNSSGEVGKSKLITCATFGMSKPRAATSVAQRTRASPLLNAANAASRWLWLRSPWISSAPTPAALNHLRTWAATRFFWTNTIVLPGTFSSCSVRSSNLSFLSGVARTKRCSMFSVVPPTLPTAMKIYCLMNSPASFWISAGNVAENIKVRRSLAAGMSRRCTNCRICGSKPMSNIRSASSRTRCSQRRNCTRPRSTKSVRRPGVATAMSHPRARSASCCRACAPP